jgi:hypothetical protein
MGGAVVCHFNIDGNDVIKNASTLRTNEEFWVHCDKVHFSYKPLAPNLTVGFAVFWGNSYSSDIQNITETSQLENPEDIHSTHSENLQLQLNFSWITYFLSFFP